MPQFNLNHILLGAVEKILYPLARVLLRYGIPYRAFQDVAKRVFVRVAHREFSLPDRKMTATRVSVLTGLPRKEVSLLLEDAGEAGVGDSPPETNASRIVAGWRRDDDFCDDRGRPTMLPFDGARISFCEVVRRYGNDVTPRAALDELLRVGALKRLQNGKFRLVANAYVPAKGEEDDLRALGEHVPELIETIEQNLDRPEDARLFAQRLVYDDVPAALLPALERRISTSAQQFMAEIEEELAGAAGETGSDLPRTDRTRIGIGIFLFDRDHEKKDHD